MKHRIWILFATSALACLLAGCQLHPRPNELNGETLPPAPTPELPYHISDMRIQTLVATGYLFSPAHTSFNDIAGPATQTIAVLKQLQSAGTLRGDGPILFVYHDPSENPAAAFDLEIGLPISKAPAALPPEFQFRTLPAFRCATVIYRGPMKLLPKAYDKLLPNMIAAGLVPSQETRESYVVWDSPDSPGNVVQIQVGIRD